MTTATSSTSSTAASDTSAGTAALAQLTQLSQTIATQAALNNDNTVTAASSVSNFSKTVTKSAYDNRATASDIGTLIHGKTRLNAFGQLGAYDKADYLKFNLTTASSVTLGKLASKDVRIQLLNKGGTVVADSDSSSGEAYTAYQQSQAGSLALTSGQYVIKISREPGAAAKTPQNYGVQVASGKYGKDYTTTVQAPSSTTGISSALSTSASLVSSLLQSGLSSS